MLRRLKVRHGFKCSCALGPDRPNDRQHGGKVVGRVGLHVSATGARQGDVPRIASLEPPALVAASATPVLSDVPAPCQNCTFVHPTEEPSVPEHDSPPWQRMIDDISLRNMATLSKSQDKLTFEDVVRLVNRETSRC